MMECVDMETKHNSASDEALRRVTKLLEVAKIFIVVLIVDADGGVRTGTVIRL